MKDKLPWKIFRPCRADAFATADTVATYDADTNIVLYNAALFESLDYLGKRAVMQLDKPTLMLATTE